MSGPKSSTYQVDPQLLRERMLEAEHQRNMSNIKKEACRKADMLFSRMMSNCSSANSTCANESSLSDVRNMLERVGKAQADGIFDDRLTCIRDELIKFGAELNDFDKQRIKQLDSELHDILSKNQITSVGKVSAIFSDQSQNTASKAALFDEEQRKKRFRLAAEELFTEAAMSDANEFVPEYDSEQSEKLIEQMQQRTDELRKIREKNTANEYVYSTALQVMKEMGYSLLGEKQTTEGIHFHSSLFKIDNDTAFSITQSSDGSVVYEVVGINDTGDLSVELTDKIEKAMLTMCDGEYDRFLNFLASKGITPTHKQRRLPPKRQFATAKKLGEYTQPSLELSSDKKQKTSNLNSMSNQKKDRKAHFYGTN